MVNDDFKSRRIVKRIIVEGDLLLKSPAHFGGGEDEDIDMALALDVLENKPIVWGTSLAGAMQNYVNERYLGYPYGNQNYKNEIEKPTSSANQLFGYQFKDNGGQSWLIVSDALAQNASIEYRDLVDIDPKTRTAVNEHKYETELITAGTYFPLKFELLIPEETENGVSEARLVEAFAIALQGLEKGEIFLGAKKNRGWGQCCVKEWKVRSYDFTTVKGLIGWLDNKRDGFEKPNSSIEELLGS